MGEIRIVGQDKTPGCPYPICKNIRYQVIKTFYINLKLKKDIIAQTMHFKV